MEKSMNMLFDQYNYIVTEEDFLTDEEIDKLTNKVGEHQQENDIFEMEIDEGRMIDLTGETPPFKSIPPSEDTSWLYTKIFNIVQQANFNFFHMKLKGWDHVKQVTYGVGNRHTIQRDFVNEVHHKKINYSIQLTDANDYEGGDLLVYERDMSHPYKASRKKGSITIFASIFMYEVTPETSGTKSTITGGFYGPPLE
jgi:hypothetical protein